MIGGIAKQAIARNAAKPASMKNIRFVLKEGYPVHFEKRESVLKRPAIQVTIRVLGAANRKLIQQERNYNLPKNLGIQ